MRHPLQMAGRLAPLLLLAAGASGGAPREDSVLLFHTNDLHGHIEYAPTLAGLVNAERARRPDVLWLDAGDVVSGTPVSSATGGTAIYTVTGRMGVDAGCLGNHEFDLGWERIASYREEAPYPILCANARSPEGALLADAEWKVLEVDGVRVGVIGVVTERTPAMTVKKGNEGVRFEPARAALERLVPEVREKCDLLVALTHVGYDDDVALARSVKGIDVIVGGHSHTDLPGPVEVGGTVIVQAHMYGKRLGRLELTVDLDRRRVARWEGKPIVVEPGKQPRDAAVGSLVDELEARVAKQVDEVVGRATRDLDRDALKGIAERAFRDALGADLGLQNDGGVRSTIARGPVTVRQIWNTFPFENTLVLVKVRGSRLPRDLARRLGPDGPDPERLYTVATNSFVADHRGKYLPGAEADPEDSGRPARDAILDWIRRHPELR